MYLFCKACVVAFVAMTRLQAMDPCVAPAPLPPFRVSETEPEDFWSLNCKEASRMSPTTTDTETLLELERKFGDADFDKRTKFKKQIADNWQKSDLEHLSTLFNELSSVFHKGKATLADIEMLKMLIALFFRREPQTKEELESRNNMITCGFQLLSGAQNLQAPGENKNHAWEAYFRGILYSPDKELSERSIRCLYSCITHPPDGLSPVILLEVSNKD